MFRGLPKQKSLIDEYDEYELKHLTIIDDDCNSSRGTNNDESIEFETVKPIPTHKQTQCRIVDDIITSNNDELIPSFNKSIYYCSNTFIFILLASTICCNTLLIYFIVKYITFGNQNPVILFIIVGIAIFYLLLCALYQLFNYPQHKLSINELQCLMDELIASYPRIKMFINGCNLFYKDPETGAFKQQFIHSFQKCYQYDHVQDISDDFDEILNIMINNRPCIHWNIMELNIYFNIRCGNEETSKHYLETRSEFISENVRTRQQKYVSSVLYLNDDGQQLNSKYLGNSPLKLGEFKQFWVVNDNSCIAKYFVSDSVYWIFCVVLLSQWLYVIIAYLLMSKKESFHVCKEIYVDQNSKQIVDKI